MTDEHIKAQKDSIQAYKDVFNTPQGRVVLGDMIKASGLYSITGVRPDSELQHMEGSRDMVRRIIHMLSIDEDKLNQIALGEGEEENE